MQGGVIRVNFPAMGVAATNLKKRAADFVTHMGEADLSAKPLKESWVDSDSNAGAAYQANWAQIVQGIVELSKTIDRLGIAVRNAGARQQEQEKRLAGKFSD